MGISLLKRSPGFYGVYGFFMFTALILVAKALRLFIKRPENYYGDKAIDTEDYPTDQLEQGSKVMISILPTAFHLHCGRISLGRFTKGHIRVLFCLSLQYLPHGRFGTCPVGIFAQVEFVGHTLDMMRVDKLSRIFGLIFCLAAFLGNLYAWHVRDLHPTDSSLTLCRSCHRSRVCW